MVALAALQTYRPSLGELTPLTADAAGFTVILLLIDAFATQRHRTLKRLHEDDEDGSDDDEVINLATAQDQGSGRRRSQRPDDSWNDEANKHLDHYHFLSDSAIRPHSGIGVGATTISAAVRWGRREALCPSPDPPSPASRGSPPRPTTPTAAPTSANTTIKDNKSHPLLLCRDMLVPTPGATGHPRPSGGAGNLGACRPGALLGARDVRGAMVG
ncbi:RhoGEF domain-containing protein [Apiospora arundinis]